MLGGIPEAGQKTKARRIRAMATEYILLAIGREDCFKRDGLKMI